MEKFCFIVACEANPVNSTPENNPVNSTPEKLIESVRTTIADELKNMSRDGGSFKVSVGSLIPVADQVPLSEVVTWLS